MAAVVRKMVTVFLIPPQKRPFNMPVLSKYSGCREVGLQFRPFLVSESKKLVASLNTLSDPEELQCETVSL